MARRESFTHGRHPMGSDSKTNKVNESQRKSEARPKKFWSLQLPDFVPALSVCSPLLPGGELQPAGATRYRVSLPITLTGDWFPPASSSFLVQRTNLLSPSVAHLPIFKVTQTVATEAHFMLTIKACQQFFLNFFSALVPPAKKFSHGCVRTNQHFRSGPSHG